MDLASKGPKTLDLVANFWPEFEFPKSMTALGQADFIVKFFTYFVVEVNDKVSYLLNIEEIGTDEFDDIQDFDSVVPLYLRSAKILRKMNQLSLNLIDFYMPNSKRMYPLVTVAIHFVIYLNNYLDEMYDIISKYCRKVLEFEEFKVLKEKYLAEDAKGAESLGRIISVFEDLNQRLSETKKSHQKMLEHKSLEESNLAKKKTKLNLLETEVDNFEYQLKLLEDSEKELLEYVVTEDECETLRQTEAYLEKEYQQLSIEDIVDRDFEDVNTYKSFAKQLSNLRVDTLVDAATNLSDVKQEVKDNLKISNDFNEELKALIQLSETERKKNERLSEMLKKAEVLSRELQTQTLKEREEEEKLLVAEIQRSAAYFEEQQRKDTAISLLEVKIQETKDNMEEMYKIVTQEYQKILKKEREATEKFQKTLMDLQNGCEEVKRRTENQ